MLSGDKHFYLCFLEGAFFLGGGEYLPCNLFQVGVLVFPDARCFHKILRIKKYKKYIRLNLESELYRDQVSSVVIFSGFRC